MCDPFDMCALGSLPQQQSASQEFPNPRRPWPHFCWGRSLQKAFFRTLVWKFPRSQSSSEPKSRNISEVVWNLGLLALTISFHKMLVALKSSVFFHFQEKEMTHGKYILTLPFCHGHGQRGAFSPIPSLLLGGFPVSLPKASSTLYSLVRALRLRSPLFFTRSGILDEQIKTSYSGLGADPGPFGHAYQRLQQPLSCSPMVDPQDPSSSQNCGALSWMLYTLQEPSFSLRIALSVH